MNDYMDFLTLKCSHELYVYANTLDMFVCTVEYSPSRADFLVYIWQASKFGTKAEWSISFVQRQHYIGRPEQ